MVFSWLVISKSLPKFSRDVAMATKLLIYYINLVKLQSYALHIQHFFASAGGLVSAISDTFLKFTRDVSMATEF